MIKIITGERRGKPLRTLEGEATRPTSMRIKEAIFSSIQFDVEGSTVLDLFAGCGQMGLEALSRGAVAATFIDLSRDAIDVVKENARATGYFEKSHFLVSDWRNFIRKSASARSYDLVFIDPPYAQACAGEAMRRLADAGLLMRGALVVLELGTERINYGDFPDFELLKATSYGRMTAVNIFVYRGMEN